MFQDCLPDVPDPWPNGKTKALACLARTQTLQAPGQNWTFFFQNATAMGC